MILPFGGSAAFPLFGGNIKTRETTPTLQTNRKRPYLLLVFGNLWQPFQFKHMTIKSLRVPMLN